MDGYGLNLNGVLFYLDCMEKKMKQGGQDDSRDWLDDFYLRQFFLLPLYAQQFCQIEQITDAVSGESREVSLSGADDDHVIIRRTVHRAGGRASGKQDGGKKHSGNKAGNN